MSIKIFSSIAVCVILALGCNKNAHEADGPDAVDDDGPMEEAGEWTDDAAEDATEAAEDVLDETGDTMETVAEETEDAVEDVADDLDGEPEAQ